ncbi:XkdW family protein [Sporanaerobacter acetigenes]|uniref:XkdW family protein n=1 Tax=Sporanaerobacter acetigenes TaxID=165813 RepID=UPI0033167E31
MMKIGRRIYFDLDTGNVIKSIGERVGSVVPTTIKQDIVTYTALSERNRDTFDYIELEYGQYAQDFAECNGYRVNIEKLVELSDDRKHEALEFSYPDPNLPPDEQEPVYIPPLSETVSTLGQELAKVKIENIQKDIITNSLGQEVTKLKLEIIQLKGGEI